MGRPRSTNWSERQQQGPRQTGTQPRTGYMGVSHLPPVPVPGGTSAMRQSTVKGRGVRTRAESRPTILYLLILRERPIRRHIGSDEHSSGVLQHLPEPSVTAPACQPFPVPEGCCPSGPALKPHGISPSGLKSHLLAQLFSLILWRTLGPPCFSCPPSLAPWHTEPGGQPML